MAVMKDVEMLAAMMAYNAPEPVESRRKKKCPVCGTPFPSRSNWGFGVGSVDTCSWRCSRLLEKGIKLEDKNMNSEKDDIMNEAMENTAEPLPETAAEPAHEAAKDESARSVFEGEDEQIIWRLEAGETLSGIARSFNRTSTALKEWARRRSPAVTAAIEAAAARRQAGQSESAKTDTAKPAEPKPERKTPLALETMLAVSEAIGSIRGLCHAELIDSYWPLIDDSLAVIREAMMSAAL